MYVQVPPAGIREPGKQTVLDGVILRPCLGLRTRFDAPSSHSAGGGDGGIANVPTSRIRIRISQAWPVFDATIWGISVALRLVVFYEILRHREDRQ